MKPQLTCSHLEPLVEQVLAAGCKVGNVSTGWSKAKVVAELLPAMPDTMRGTITGGASHLRYYKYIGSPHNKPDEGFVCDNCHVVISFPV